LNAPELPKRRWGRCAISMREMTFGFRSFLARDLGTRAFIVEENAGSSADESHGSLVRLYHSRFRLARRICGMQEAETIMTNDANVHAGQCHCGGVRFEATLSDGFNTIRRCTCSFCRMRGAVVVSVEMGGIRFLQGEDALTSYRFNTGSAQHFFCSRCGIYTHHQRRSNQNEYGVNVACLDGVSPFDFLEVPVSDGVNHPSDTGMPARRVGTLRFIPAA
jgi:hypothetical protein